MSGSAFFEIMKRSGSVVLFFFLLCFASSDRDARAESSDADSSLVVEIVSDGLPLFGRVDARLEVALVDDSDDVLEQITRLQDASKPALEPLIKQYMYAVERLMQSSSPGSDDKERQRLIAEVNSSEAQRDAILGEYHLRIHDLLASHTRKRLEVAAASLPARLDAISPGRYRVHVVLTVETTQFHWFEPMEIQGGDCLVIRLRRDNVKNPDWTDVNWWSFMNLDFSKHHRIPQNQ